MLRPQIINSAETPKYDHGFSESEEYEIKQEYKRLQQKVDNGEKLTLDEQVVVFKHFRLLRTEAFVLQEKLKDLKPKKERKEKSEKAEKVVKEKKLTKKYIKERIKQLIDLQHTEGLSPEQVDELLNLEQR
jgi:hypothetical protein